MTRLSLFPWLLHVAMLTACTTPVPETPKDSTAACETENAFYHQRYGLGAEGVTALRSDAVPRFYFTVTEGGFDPCAPLSYSVLTGSYGDLEKPNGIVASTAQGLIVWDGPNPLANTGVTAASIEDVQVIGADTLRATFGRRAGATAEGVTERATVQLRIQGDQHVPVGGDVELYVSIIAETPTIIP
ncbi:hypothetical protein [Corynebacterium singulare]|uniref:Secreted protein n=1 Tax=Corynebacterium singulare TaxID=161899 RepID=A0ABS9PTZ3_9CORY|nr:hypothetical protein [Corynebacterium singulare]MCG7276186.1 hypothetical protein [Corynebacterium singulare]